jgi:hypothetical protein
MEDIEKLKIELEVLRVQHKKVRDKIEMLIEEKENNEKTEYESKPTHNIFEIGQFVKNEKHIVKVTEMLDKGYFLGLGFNMVWGNWEYRNRKYKSDDYTVINESFYNKNHILQIELTPSEMLELKMDMRERTNFADSIYQKIFEWICETENKRNVKN